MLENSLGNLIFGGIAVGLFVWSSNIGANDAPPPEPQAAASAVVAQTAPAPLAAPVAAVPPPTPPIVAPQPVDPAPPVVAPQPVAQPMASAPPVVAPPVPAPRPVAQPAPQPVAPAVPVVGAVNPDDAPSAVAKSGKVARSTNPDEPPAFGPKDAKVHVIIFSDFQCPVCRRAKEATHQIAEEFPGEIRLEFWQHALKMHRNAERSALASLAAHRQGKFWEYHDLLFANQSGLDDLSLSTYAQQAGLDMAKFTQDIADPALKAMMDKQGGFAEAMGARGTPAFLVNGKLSVGWGSWNGFRGQVERELNQARSAGSKGWKLMAERAKANAGENSGVYIKTALAHLKTK